MITKTKAPASKSGRISRKTTKSSPAKKANTGHIKQTKRAASSKTASSTTAKGHAPAKKTSQTKTTPKKPTTKNAKAPRARAKSTSVPEVLVRMYNVGFGDCFLVEFPKDGDVLRVLVDCGSTSKGSLSMPDLVDTLLADVADPKLGNAPRIDVVVCTHRHADHVSGFANEAWKSLHVKEVWMPWTEDPKDPKAKKIREAQSSLAKGLQVHLQAALRAGADASIQWQLDLAENALSNAAAMEQLHKKFSPEPKRLYLSSDGSPLTVKTNALPGVKAFVLGPSKDEAVIRDMNPEKGQTYLRQLSQATRDGEPFEPFADNWQFDPNSYSTKLSKLSKRDVSLLAEASSSWNPAIAVALDAAVNGTSLVLAFQMGEALLFFPGDAQWGTWKALLENSDTQELLGKAKLWKVGHHGSHNATPKDFLEKNATVDCCAMMSTKMGKFKSIPRAPLLDAVKSKGIELARSDAPIPSPSKRFSLGRSSQIETKIPI